MRLACAVLLLGGVAGAAEPAPTVGGFLRALFAAHEPELRRRIDGEWRAATADGLLATPTNERRFAQAMFVYHLVRHGAILGNTFVIREDDGRHPDVMLRDAFSDGPHYQVWYSSGWQGGATRVARGDVFAYGRCDEFEMEASALMRRLFGLPARIALLTPDHVVTEVAMEGGYLRLDASFLRCVVFARTRIDDAPPEDGVYSVARTNRIALRDFHPGLPISAAAARRVEAAFLRFVGAAEPDAVYCRASD